MAREFTNCYQGRTELELRRILREPPQALGKSFDGLDAAALLRIIKYSWHDVFYGILRSAGRNLVYELEEVRNRWAHQEAFSTDDAYRALDSAHRLLMLASSPQADEVKKMRDSLRPSPVPPVLESAFHEAMLNVYHTARSVGHDPTRFLQMVNEHGGVDAAKRLLRTPEIPYGLKKLGELGRLDISMEALVLEDQWLPLFTDEERRVARTHLEELGYFGEYEWRSLPELQPESGATHPGWMLFPDGGRAELTAWASIQREAVRWLIDHRMLNVPVPGRARGKLLVNTRPVHLDGSPFPESSEVNGWFVSMGMDALDIIKRTNHIIEHVGQAPAQFKVRSPSR